MRIDFITLAMLALAASGLTACNSFQPCEAHFGSRVLPGEHVQSGVPSQLVGACMYGADTVGPIILYRSTPEIECSKQYGVSRISTENGPLTEAVSNTLEKMDACVAGAKGYIHTLFTVNASSTRFEVQNCERMRGKDGFNPNLPCD